MLKTPIKIKRIQSFVAEKKRLCYIYYLGIRKYNNTAPNILFLFCHCSDLQKFSYPLSLIIPHKIR